MVLVLAARTAQLAAAMTITHDQPFPVQLMYGPDLLEFFCFGVLGDGNCLFAVGSYIQLSCNIDYQEANNGKEWCRDLPKSAAISEVEKVFRSAWEKRPVSTCRSLTISPEGGHVYGETGLAFTSRVNDPYGISRGRNLPFCF